MIRDPDDLTHVLRMVLNDNMGQRITEALIIGIDESVHHYLSAVTHATNGMTGPFTQEELNGTPT